MKHKCTALWVLAMLFDISAVICSIVGLITGYYRLFLLFALLIVTGTALSIIDVIVEKRKQ